MAATVQQMHGEPDQSWEHFADTAYAVVRDMHEPTEAMVTAGQDKTGVDAWRAMLDVVLNEHVQLDSEDAMTSQERHLGDDDSGEGDPLFSTGP